MVTGHLRERNGYYHIVLNYVDENGKRKTPSKSTGLPVKGNKKRAQSMLEDERAKLEETLLQIIGNKKVGGADDMSFTKFMLKWVNMMKNSVEVTTFAAYKAIIERKINPYFDYFYPNIKVGEITPIHIQEFYTYELEEKGLSANSVIHIHANIRKALQYAYKIDLIKSNPADKVERPKKEPYLANYYNAQELERLFKVVKGEFIELGVIIAAFYGLRRSEIVGLKWEAIDFEQKTISIRHIVTETSVDGKFTIIPKDRPKSKSSYRTLPLVKPFEDLLLQIKKQQEIDRRVCGDSYCKDYLEYVYLDRIGKLIKPNYLTQRFHNIIEQNHMKPIRFHDLRHSCASALYANGVDIKQIQAWLGHSDITTTTSIYTHMEFESKENSARAIMKIYPVNAIDDFVFENSEGVLEGNCENSAVFT